MLQRAFSLHWMTVKKSTWGTPERVSQEKPANRRAKKQTSCEVHVMAGYKL